MEDITDYLLNFKYPPNHNRPNLKYGDEIHYGCALGLINNRPVSYMKLGLPKQAECRLLKNKRYAECYLYGIYLYNQLTTDLKFHYTTIQYNYNQVSKKHKDKKNIGESYIVAIGDYTGGRLKVWKDEKGEGDPDYIDIKNKLYKFNGSKYYHETEEFVGTRISLVYFSIL